MSTCAVGISPACSTVPMVLDCIARDPSASSVVAPKRRVHPCGLAALDTLLGGGFPCRALLQVFLVSVPGLTCVLISTTTSLGCSWRLPATNTSTLSILEAFYVRRALSAAWPATTPTYTVRSAASTCASPVTSRVCNVAGGASTVRAS